MEMVSSPDLISDFGHKFTCALSYPHFFICTVNGHSWAKSFCRTVMHTSFQILLSQNDFIYMFIGRSGRSAHLRWPRNVKQNAKAITQSQNTTQVRDNGWGQCFAMAFAYMFMAFAFVLQLLHPARHFRATVLSSVIQVNVPVKQWTSLFCAWD